MGRGVCPNCGHAAEQERQGEVTVKVAVLHTGRTPVTGRCAQSGCAGIIQLDFITIQPAPPSTRPRRLTRARE
jgi:hypothetical protein